MSQAQLATPAVAVESMPVDADGILGPLDYLQQSLRTRQLFAVLTGPLGSGKTELLRQCLAAQDCCANVVHVTEPLYEPHEFMEVSLEQLGFEPFESSEHELLKLMQVFLRHEHSQGRRTLFVLEQAEAWGPRVFATIQKLAEAHVKEAAMTFLLVGLPALNRVLDSAAMLTIASMTQDRFALPSVPVSQAQEASPGAQTQPFLLVTTDGRMTQRCSLENSQLLIGRHAQNDLKLNSRYVSRHHALLVNRSGKRYIVDLNSTNGTFVNSTQVDEQALCHGDVITIGSCRLKYVCPRMHVKTRTAAVGESAHDTISARPLLPRKMIREPAGVGVEISP